MTDTPFPTDLVESANVTFERIEIKMRNSKENAYVDLNRVSFTQNLLDLVNGRVLEITNTEIPVGTYQLIKLYISDAQIVFHDGRTYNPVVPSYAQTGVEVAFSEDIIFDKDQEIEFLLDFNVAESFTPIGDIYVPSEFDGFEFNPVITIIEKSKVGNLIGTVTDSTMAPIEGVSLTLMNSGIVSTSTFSDSQGNYAFFASEKDKYDLLVEAPGYTSQFIEKIKIKQSKTTVLDIELLQQ
jgi:hypothetical protein